MMTEHKRKTSSGTLTQMMQHAAGKAGNTVIDIPLTQIRALKQVRFNFRKIEELSESLVVEGQQTPVIVSPLNDEGIYILQKGERRLRAAKLAGLKSIRAIVNTPLKDSLEETAGQLIENLQREDLEPMEIAFALQEFVDAGWTQKQIARRISKNQAYVYRHLGMLSLPEVIAELYDNEVVRDITTLLALKALYSEDKDAAESLCAQAIENEGLARGRVTSELKRVKEIKALAAEGKKAAQAQQDANPEDSEGAGHGESAEQEHSDPLSPSSFIEAQELSDESPSDDAGSPATPADPAPRQSMYTPPETAYKKMEVTSGQSLRIGVTILNEENKAVAGTLLLNTVSPSPSFAWVITDDEGEELLVHVTRIGVDSITAN